MGSDIRLGQLIAPFGPGSIYTDKYGVPTVICGLDYWYKKINGQGELQEMGDAVSNSIVFEPRLADLLSVSHFRQPPQNLYDSNNPDLSALKVQGHRFPRWYVNNATGELKRFNLETTRIERPQKGAWRPVRFIAVCQSGHMADFPWQTWSGCTCNNEAGLVLNDSGGPDLGSITIRCQQCNKSKSLAGATVLNRDEQTKEISSTGLSSVGINCRGERPWLGNQATEGGCNNPLAAVLINQSNVYFARIISSIFLPDVSADSEMAEIQDVLLDGDQTYLVSVKLAHSMHDWDAFFFHIKRKIKNYYSNDDMPGDEIIRQAYERLGKGGFCGALASVPSLPDSKNLAFRREEFNILRSKIMDGTSSELRIVPAVVPPKLQAFFAKVNLVERLRETRVVYGFDRLERSRDPLDGMPETALGRLFLTPPNRDMTWLPAVKNYGEGIYLELPEEALAGWLQNNSDWLQTRYDASFVNRMSNEPLLFPPSANIDWQWAARYQLVHTLAHILINQLVFECGYSSASLKERLFVSSDDRAPMSGILIYTASGDSEGSLGGLVRMGRTELFESMVRRAVSRASWCSADPVCSENLGGAGSRLVNMAACHACTLLPETACETINNGLDRAAVVGVPENQGIGYLSGLLDSYIV